MYSVYNYIGVVVDVCFVLLQVVPQLSTIQTELAQTVLEMTKCQKTYNVDETYSHEARQKAGDADDK